MKQKKLVVVLVVYCLEKPQPVTLAGWLRVLVMLAGWLWFLLLGNGEHVG